MGGKLIKTPKDPYLREQFFKLKRNYRRTSRKKKGKCEENILQTFKTLQFSNNGVFGDFLKQMKGSNFDRHFNDETLPLIQDLSKHYKELLQKKHNQQQNNLMKVKTLKTLTH